MAEGRRDKSDFDALPGLITQRQCQPCSRKDKQTAADVFCSTCDEFQCTKCSDIHNLNAYSKTHMLVNANELKSKPVTLDLDGLDLCEKHKRKYEFFCEDDMKLCCSNCAIVNHRKCHSVQEIEFIAEKHRSATPNFNATLQDMKEKAEMVEKHMQMSIEQLRQNIHDLPKKISHMQNEMNKIFEDLKCHVSKETEKIQTQTEEKLMKKQAISESLITEINNSLELINNVHQNGTTSQAFILDHRIKGQIKELQIELDKACQDIETVTVSFDFDETLQLPPRPISDYVPGQLTLKYNIPESLKSIVYKPQSVELERINSIDLNQAGDDVKELLYTGLDFLPDGRLVAVDNKNMKCLVFNEKLEKVGSYQLSYMPQSVVVVSEEEVVITSADVYKIEFLRVSKSSEDHTMYIYDVETDTSVVVKDDRIKFPRGVAVGPSNILMVCCQDTDSLVQITTTGQILASFELDMYFPYRVCVSRDMSILAVTNSCTERKLQLFNVKH